MFPNILIMSKTNLVRQAFLLADVKGKYLKVNKELQLLDQDP